MPIQSLRAPRQLRLVFVAVMMLLASTFGLLAWRLLDQERQLAAGLLRDQREAAAELAVTSLAKKLWSIEDSLGRMLLDTNDTRPDASAAGSLWIRFAPGVLQAWPEGRLIYHPELPEAPEASRELFSAADGLEFRANDYRGAAALLGDLAASSDAKVRAAALVRIARNRRKAGLLREALQSYRQMEALGSASVGGMPAGLAAADGEMTVFEQQGDIDALSDKARGVVRDLETGRWLVSPAAFVYVSERARASLPAAERRPIAGVALAEAVESLWEQWSRGALASAGRRSVVTSAGSVSIVWRVSGKTVAGFAASADWIEREWLKDLRPLLAVRQVRLALSADESPAVGNGSDSGGRAAVRRVSDTSLPWAIHVFSTADADRALAFRRTLLILGMAALATLILVGGWFIGNTVARELAVARLQSDFVAAVSHEFRTPLTALCQLSELLRRGRVANEEDRSHYYDALYNESHRLRRLVESLLSFGRLEAGKAQLRLETIDAAALVRDTAEEFARTQQAEGRHFEFETPAEAPLVHADRETLRCVFWNLFENAVKYSPQCDTVWVALARKNGQVEIAVRDRGLGVPRSEQRRIFGKFVRGAAARENNIRGTGIGLAMAREIVRAHGGEIAVESEPGQGSTFRVRLPGVNA